MFVQIIEGKVKDADLLLRQTDRWVAEIKPGVKGFLGSTGGVTPDGRSIWIARFESAEAAHANGARPEQDAWWNETVKAYDGEPTFHDTTDVDELLGGGSNDAGFVQAISARPKDASAMRARMRELEGDLRDRRPDILGIVVAWHGDGELTQIVYFRSEDETRQQEKASGDDEMAREFMTMFAGQPTFYDLTDPRLA
jgi:hypothetical protein